MKRLTFAFTVLVSLTFAARAATLPASEDSYGFRAKLTLVANKATTLPVDATHRAFLWFNLADIPAGAQIRYARLRLYLPRVIRTGGGLTVHKVMGGWDESQASAEPSVDAAPVATIPGSEIGGRRFISTDVTATIQAWLANPPSNEGFAVAAVPGVDAKLTGSVFLGAKEGSGSGYPAELDVELVSSAVAAGAIGTTELATGAVQSSNIATGAVGSTQLAQNLTLAGTTSGVFNGDGSKLSVLNVSAVAKATDAANFMAWVPVANPGNVADGTGFGAVLQPFKIGKYEVTNAQYVTFLNAIAAIDPYELFDPQMSSNPRGGINRSGAQGSFTYSTRKAMADKPVTFVNWYDCIRFANWMHNNMPTGAQGPATTEDGAYTISGNGPDWTVSTRNAAANAWLPSEDEWYKAAHFDPSKDNETGGYWLYPTQSDTPPATATCDAVGNITNKSLNIANYDSGAVWGGLTGNLTTVGSGGPGSESAYHAADMGGNAFEWTEGIMMGTRRVVRGNSWNFQANGLPSTYRSSDLPAGRNNYTGFRVATH